MLSDSSASALVLTLLPAFAAAAELRAEGARSLGEVVDRLVRFTRDSAYPGDDWGEIEVTLETGDGVVHVSVHDWGCRSRARAVTSARCRSRSQRSVPTRGTCCS